MFKLVTGNFSEGLNFSSASADREVQAFFSPFGSKDTVLSINPLCFSVARTILKHLEKEMGPLSAIISRRR